MTNSISLRKDGVDIQVSVYVFKDGGAYVAYCPSLDLSGYDTTEAGARDDFSFMLRDWLTTQLKHGTLQKDLMKHGFSLA